MGLALAVGIFAQLDPEEHADWRGCFEQLNEVLVERGLYPHEEPEECDAWDGEMIGYSGLHDVRRLAAYLDSGSKLPEPATRDLDTSKDPRLEAYFDAVNGKKGGWLPGLLGRPKFARRFDHLIVHSDAEGFYVPQDFEEVIIVSDDRVPGAMIGSAPRLLAELEVIASALEIPARLSAASEELWEASDSPADPDGETWERYGRETFGCVVLREGCRRAIETGAALVFT